MGQKRTYKIKKHQWEKDLPKPPTSRQVLQQVVLSKVSYYQPKTTVELLQDVVDEYGFITERTLYRYLAVLKKKDLVKSVVYDAETPSYLRKGSWSAEVKKINRNLSKLDALEKKAA